MATGSSNFLFELLLAFLSCRTSRLNEADIICAVGYKQETHGIVFQPFPKLSPRRSKHSLSNSIHKYWQILSNGSCSCNFARVYFVNETIESNQLENCRLACWCLFVKSCLDDDDRKIFKIKLLVNLQNYHQLLKKD